MRQDKTHTLLIWRSGLKYVVPVLLRITIIFSSNTTYHHNLRTTKGRITDNRCVTMLKHLLNPKMNFQSIILEIKTTLSKTNEIQYYQMLI